MKNKIIKLFYIFFNKKTWGYLIKKIIVASEHRFLIKSFGGLSTVVDIGANKGQFSALIRIIFPKAVIYAFEPLEKPFSILTKAFKKDKKIHLFNYAIGPFNVESEMHISKREDSSSLLPITHQQSEIFPGTEEVQQQKIKVKRLIELIKIEDLNKPCLMKIDVQGYELEVLKGSSEFLPYMDYIYVECSFIELYKGQALVQDVIYFLNENNFSLIGVYNIHYDKSGISVQGDFLFKRLKP